MGRRRAGLMGRRRVGLVCVVAATLLVSGCSGEPELAAPSPTGNAAEQCRRAMDALPKTLMEQTRTSLDGFTATWGNPRITVRCGVERPAALQQTSRCDVVNGVGWFAEEPGTVHEASWLFTTIGRATYLELVLPTAYQPPAGALVDLAPAARELREVKPCA